jgi:hypothetical protein
MVVAEGVAVATKCLVSSAIVAAVADAAAGGVAAP